MIERENFLQNIIELPKLEDKINQNKFYEGPQSALEMLSSDSISHILSDSNSIMSSLNTNSVNNKSQLSNPNSYGGIKTVPNKQLILTERLIDI